MMTLPSSTVKRRTAFQRQSDDPIRVRVGIIGDYDPNRESHVATVKALEHAGDALGVEVEGAWLPTPSLEDDAQDGLTALDGVWCAPGSPYRSLEGALSAIRIARGANLPLLGTCGGFQHVVLEYARNVLGVKDAQHAEYAPEAPEPFVAPLACSLVGREMRVRLEPSSKVHTFYGRDEVIEEYRCSFGVNREHQHLLNKGGLRVVGMGEDGEARIVTLPSHRFFVATLFVPQLRSRPGNPHPLVKAFVHELTRSRA